MACLVLDTRLPKAWTRLPGLIAETFLLEEPSVLSLGAHNHEQHAYTVDVAHGSGNRMLPCGSGLLLHVRVRSDLETLANACARVHVWGSTFEQDLCHTEAHVCRLSGAT